jgi:hypothetical protein
MGRKKHSSKYTLPLFILGFVFKLLILSTVFTVTSVGDAEARKSDQCSANGQEPCPVYYPGERCDAWLSEQKGICSPCGGKDQKSCPVIKKGEQCKTNLSKNSRGICVGCGGLNEKACPVIKGGERCNAGLSKNSRDICTPCGGENQKACPVIKNGTICQAGLGKFEGICRPCGTEGERACPALEVGRQCELWTTQRDDICQPCGDVGARACRITDKGKACKPGLRRALDGICVFDEKEMIRINAEAKLDELSTQVMAAAFGVSDANQNDELVDSLTNEDDAAEEHIPEDNNLCPSDAQAWSISVESDVSFIIGGEGEIGMAWRCADFSAERKDSKWFANSGYNWRPGFGAGGGLTFGFWQDDVENLRGKSHGYVFDLVQLIQNAKGGPLAELQKELDKLNDKEPEADFSLTVGFWYADYPEDDPRALENAGFDWRPRFIGWTISIGGGVGWELGAVYSKINTVQVCRAEMKCAEGIWEGGGKTLIVSGQTTDGLYAREENSDERLYFDRVLVAGRKYKYIDDQDTEDDDDDVKQLIRFRKNFTLLKYDDGTNKYELTRAGDVPEAETEENTEALRSRPLQNDESTAEQGRNQPAGGGNQTNILGVWVYKVAGNSFKDEILVVGDGYIITRRVGTNYLIRYKKSGAGSYQSDAGSELRFVSGNRALWVSPDRKTVFQWKKQ